MATPAPLRTLIVDDEALARRRLAAMLAEFNDLTIVGEADAGSTAVEAIARERPDIVFLDVQMPGLDGFGVLRCTAGAHRPVVIFVTAHDAHAIRAFEVHAADYLLKPVTTVRLKEAVRRAVERARSVTQKEEARGLEGLLSEMPATPVEGARIPVRGDGGVDLVNVADITWVEADGDLARLHVGAKAVTLRETMSALEIRLAPFRFVRVHRSAIISTDAVRSVESIEKGNYFVVLRDGTRVRSGRRYREQVQRLIRR
ncbi:MAG: DNA-binding response regulator [Gemmatimonas sp.]|nr:DNA-binding response regulator [Gemmatimonas sp.]